MASICMHLLLTITIIVTLFAFGSSNPNFQNGPQNWKFEFNYTNGPFRRPKPVQNSRRIIVGGSDNWRFGFNYTEWARTNAPFFFNDTLVFKFDPPSDTNIHPHSVYLFPSLWSFLRCDLRWAKRVANTSQGEGEGFEFVLNKWKPYYFACGESNGFHCQSGMKFFVMPSFRWY
ncbi:putative Phytocyanin domain, cupredoxin [Helianthus annuus]|nr:putative Phytocyanin domain, cupredoxin [Helianthus annuus]KAJ0820493.1 putative Phytocyanin domain, cupredoxin [Helianthus annuus]